MGGVAGAQRLRLGRVAQLGERVLADGLQHVEARLALHLAAQKQALVAERSQAIEDVERRVGGEHAHRLGGLEVEAAGEDRDAAEQDPVGLVEELVAPGDGGAQRPVARLAVTRVAAQEAQAIAQALAQGRQRQHLHA